MLVIRLPNKQLVLDVAVETSATSVLRQHHFRFVLGLLIAAALLFGVTRFINLAKALDATADYPRLNLILVLSLSLAYFLLKAARWHYLLGLLNIKLPWRRSVLIYLAGQWFAVAPAGEFVRAYLLTSYGYSFRRASAGVMAQILFDFLSLSVVGSAFTFRQGQLDGPVLVFTAALLLATLLFGHAPALTRRLVPASVLASRSSRTKRLADLYRYSRFLLAWRSFLVALALAVTAVAAGSLVLLYVSLGYEIPIQFGQAAYIYSLSQLAGALSMLPHGLGAAEGSALALFHYAGIDVTSAAAAVVLFRLCTLGWGLLIGGLALLALRTRLAGSPIDRSS